MAEKKKTFKLSRGNPSDLNIPDGITKKRLEIWEYFVAIEENERRLAALQNSDAASML